MRPGFSLRSWLAVSIAMTAGLACGSERARYDLEPYLGRWRYEEGLAKCADPVASFPLRSFEVEITAVSADELAFQGQTECRLELEVVEAEARGTGMCQFRNRLTTTNGRFERFALSPADTGRLSNEAEGRTTIDIDASTTAPGATLDCPRFYFEGARLARISDPP